MAQRIDWGRFTEEETIAAVEAGLRELSEDNAVSVIRKFVNEFDINVAILDSEE